MCKEYYPLILKHSDQQETKCAIHRTEESVNNIGYGKARFLNWEAIDCWYLEEIRNQLESILEELDKPIIRMATQLSDIQDSLQGRFTDNLLRNKLSDNFT